MAELKLGDETITYSWELSKHYDINSVFECAKDGTLLQWLKDCEYYSKDIEAIELLCKQNDGHWDRYDIATHINLYQVIHNIDMLDIPIIAITNLSELCDNYHFIVILDCFKKGILSVWLEKNGYIDESNAIKSLPKDLSDFRLHRHIYKILHNLNEMPFIVGQTHILKIDDLRKNYDFADILEHFKSGELVAWLEQNGYSNEANAIKSLPKDLREAQIHLKLCKIFIGIKKIPRCIIEWFGAYYDKWVKKTDELSALLDKALLLCEVFEKNNYVISKAEEKEIKSLSGKINKVADKVEKLYREYCFYAMKVRDEGGFRTTSPLETQWDDTYIIRKLGILYNNRYKASEAKKERLCKMPISKFFKKNNS